MDLRNTALVINGNPCNPDLLPYCPFRVKVEEDEVLLEYHQGGTVRVQGDEFNELIEEGLVQEIRVTKSLLGHPTPGDAIAEVSQVFPGLTGTTWQRIDDPTTVWRVACVVPCTYKDGSWGIRIILTSLKGHRRATPSLESFTATFVAK